MLKLALVLLAVFALFITQPFPGFSQIEIEIPTIEDESQETMIQS
jgi:hypothetical protein